METNRIKTVKELQEELACEIGTASYYRAPLGRLVYTDGVKHLAETVEAYWLIDLVESYIRKISTNMRIWHFSIIRLNVGLPDFFGDRKCEFDIREDDGIEPFIVQELDYTDFPEGVFELYFSEGVLMLKTEY